MAKHEIDMTDADEKGLAFVTDRRNADLDPKATPLTVDEYIAFVFAPVFADWTRQAGVAVETPIVAELKKIISQGDDVKLQAVKDALGIAAEAAVDIKK